MKRFIYIVLSCCVLLGGCDYLSSSQVGMPLPEWQKLSDETKSQLKDTASVLESCVQPIKYIDHDFPVSVDVTLMGGYCKSIPSQKVKSFTEKKIVLNNHECKTVLLTVDPGKEFCLLKVCYKDGGLHFDCGTERHFAATVLIPNNPLWQYGFTYNGFHTTGKASLSSAKVTVKSRE